MARVKKNSDKKKVKKKAIQFQMGWGGLVALVVSTLCVLLWTFIMGFWVGQKLIGRKGTPHKNLTVLNKMGETASGPQVAVTDQNEGPAFPPVITPQNTAPVSSGTSGASAVNQPLPTEIIRGEAQNASPQAEAEKSSEVSAPAVRSEQSVAPPKTENKRSPAKVSTTKASVEKKEVKKRTPPPAKTYFVLQIASYRERSRAEREAARWRKKGITAQVVRVAIKNKGIWYRVYLGRYNSVQDATAGAKRLARKEGIRSYVVPIKR